MSTKATQSQLRVKRFRLEGKVSEFGLEAYVHNDLGGIANIGNENTNNLTIFSHHAAVRNQSSKITLDAKNINLYTTESVRGYGAVEINGAENGADSTTVIGKNVETISISANQLETSKITI